MAKKKSTKQARPVVKNQKAPHKTGSKKTAKSAQKSSPKKNATDNKAKPSTNGKPAKPVKSSSGQSKKIAGASNKPFKARANGSDDERGLNPQTYQRLRQDIISTLWKYDEITFDELTAAMEKIHGKNFVSDSLKYIRQVISDLLNIDLIEQIERDYNRSIFRIRQRLSE